MADQLRSNELFQLINTRNNSLMEIVSELVQAVPGQGGAGLLSPEMVAKLNAMRDAPMSKAWTRKIFGEIDSEKKLPLIKSRSKPRMTFIMNFLGLTVSL